MYALHYSTILCCIINATYSITLPLFLFDNSKKPIDESMNQPTTNTHRNSTFTTNMIFYNSIPKYYYTNRRMRMPLFSVVK